MAGEGHIPCLVGGGGSAPPVAGGGSQKRPAELEQPGDGAAGHLPSKSPRLAAVLPDSLPGSGGGSDEESLQSQLAAALAERSRWREESEGQRRQLEQALHKVAMLEGMVGGSRVGGQQGGGAEGSGAQQHNGVDQSAQIKALQAQLGQQKQQLGQQRQQLDQMKQQNDMLRMANKSHAEKVVQLELQLKQAHGELQQLRSVQMRQSPAGGGLMGGPPYTVPPPRGPHGTHGMPPPPGLPPHSAPAPYPPQPAPHGSWPQQHAQGGYYGAQPPPQPAAPQGGLAAGGYYDNWSGWGAAGAGGAPGAPPQPGAPAAQGGGGEYWGAGATAQGGPQAAGQPSGSHAPYYSQPQAHPDPYPPQGPAQGSVQGAGAYQPPPAAAAGGGGPSGGSAPRSGGGSANAPTEAETEQLWWELDQRKREVIERFARAYPMMVDPSQAKDMVITDFKDMTEAQLEGFFMWLSGHCNPTKQLRFPGGFVRVKHTEWKKLFGINI